MSDKNRPNQVADYLREIASPKCPKCDRPVGGIVAEGELRLHCPCGWRNYEKKARESLRPAAEMDDLDLPYTQVLLRRVCLKKRQFRMFLGQEKGPGGHDCGDYYQCLLSPRPVIESGLYRQGRAAANGQKQSFNWSTCLFPQVFPLLRQARI